jgi:hypothetical protein
VRTKRVAAGAATVAVLAATAATSLANAAANDDRIPAKTIPTLPSTSEATSEGSSTASSGEPATGIGLRAEASLPEFLPVVNGVIGATGDVAGELAALAAVPDGILSPDGSSIREFSVDYSGPDEQFVATATFSSDANAEDAIVFYQATLTAAGFTPVADSGATEGGTASRHLRFENPNSRLADAAVDVVVNDGENTDIELTITDAIDADVLNAFTGWAAGLPTLPEATPIEATIRVTTGATTSDLTLTLSTRFAYHEYTPDALAAAVRAGLPDGGFTIDTDHDDGSGTSIALRHIALEELTLEISTGEIGTGEIGTGEIGTGEIGTGEISTREIGTGNSHPTTLLLSGTIRL